jgi:hypothetical protein
MFIIILMIIIIEEAVCYAPGGRRDRGQRVSESGGGAAGASWRAADAPGVYRMPIPVSYRGP